MVDFVQRAETFVKEKLSRIDVRGARRIDLSTSQIRKFLSAVNRIENQIVAEGEQLSEDMVNEIKYLKIMLAYQAGRERAVKPLYEELVIEIDKIGESKKKFVEFARYVEAIVAYHKYYGGN